MVGAMETNCTTQPGTQGWHDRGPGGAFSCMVRNMSKGGAAVDVPSLTGIPNEFSLLLLLEGRCV
jgi:hypothetical protein